MGKWLLSTAVAFFCAALVASDAEAKRLGGGRSIGAQRNVTAPPAATPAKPGQEHAAPAQGTQAAGAQQGAQAAQQPGRWGMFGGILGGLALGGLLGYLFGGSGLLALVLLAAVAIAVVLGMRALARRSAETRVQSVRLAGTNETLMTREPLQASAAAPVASGARSLPAGFDAGSFLRAAKMNFIKLQMANDFGRLDEIREFTTREVFEALRRDIEPGASTDVVALDADLLDVSQDRGEYWASVRFSGRIRETTGGEAVPFEEVWNLVKPTDGSSGWLLAGIQQMH